jgi:hypothetical protein
MWPRAGQLVRRSTIGIARRRFGAIRGVGGCARPVAKRKEWQVEEREKERENRISLNIDIWATHAATKRGAGGSALILAVRISLGWEEEDKNDGGVCPNDVTTDPSGSLSRMVCWQRRKRGTCNQSFVINLWVCCPLFLTGVAEDNGICKNREREWKWGLLWLANVEW